MQHPLVLDFICNVRHAAQPAITADGSRVAYVVHEVDSESFEQDSTLWIATVDGTTHDPVQTDADSVSNPFWSHDGATLYFVATVGEDSVLQSVSASGDHTTLASFPAAPSGLSLSPDGTTLAFVAKYDPSTDAPFVSGLPPVRVIDRIDYKLDGHGIPNNVQMQVHLLDLETGITRRVTEGRWDYGSLAWSSDGRLLAGIRRRRIGFESMLSLIDTTTGKEEVFGEERSSVRSLGWTPDGATLVWSRGQLHGYRGDFARMDVATREISSICDLPSWAWGYIGEPLIATGLGEFLITGHSEARAGLWSVNIETGEIVRKFGADATHHGLVVSTDADVAIQVHESAEATSELVAISLETGELTRITQLNDAWFAAHPPASIELRSVRNEDLDVPYMLKLPHDFDPEKIYPVVFEMHGGPHLFRGFSIEGSNQMFLDAGYIVANPNPRGSTSWSLDYAKGVHGDWGGGDWRDDMAVFNAVAALPFVDENRMGIYGYSYGGYITSWAIGQTDRFKAAVIGAPLTDLVSREGTADLGFDSPWAEFAGAWKDIPKYFADRSPMTHVHKAVTPTLILHPEDDQRCPIGQSEQLFVGLKMAGVETRFIRYPGQSHLMPWNGPPEYMVDFYSRILDWFLQYIPVE